MAYKLAEEAWPKGGTPLFKEVQSPYFLPVTDEILAEIVRRIVAKFDPEQIILFGSYAYGEEQLFHYMDFVSARVFLYL